MQQDGAAQRAIDAGNPDCPHRRGSRHRGEAADECVDAAFARRTGGNTAIIAVTSAEADRALNRQPRIIARTRAHTQYILIDPELDLARGNSRLTDAALARALKLWA